MKDICEKLDLKNVEVVCSEGFWMTEHITPTERSDWGPSFRPTSKSFIGKRELSLGDWAGKLLSIMEKL